MLFFYMYTPSNSTGACIDVQAIRGEPISTSIFRATRAYRTITALTPQPPPDIKSTPYHQHFTHSLLAAAPSWNSATAKIGYLSHWSSRGKLWQQHLFSSSNFFRFQIFAKQYTVRDTRTSSSHPSTHNPSTDHCILFPAQLFVEHEFP